MATRLTLLCAAATASSRTGGFPSPGEPLDEAGLRAARDFRWRGPAPDPVLSSPSQAAIETARAMGFAPGIAPLAADLGCGAWAGRTLTEVEGSDPEALRRWIADPAGAMPGGETMDEVVRRIRMLIDRSIEGEPRAVLIVTHATAIRAALVHTLGIPAAAAIRIDVAPLGLVQLSWHRQWRLQELRLPKAG